MSPSDNRGLPNGRAPGGPPGVQSGNSGPPRSEGPRGDGPRVDRPGKPAEPRINWVTVILLFLAFNWIVSLFTGHPAEADLSYDRFMAQLSAANVKSVLFQGETVEGVLKKSIVVPVAQSFLSRGKKSTQRLSQFRTVLPPTGDPGLLPLLEKQKVSITALPQSSPWFWNLLLSLAFPLLMLILLWIWFRQSRGGGVTSVFGFGKSRARLYNEESPRITFADVAGEEESKQELTEIVDFLKHPAKYHKLGGKIPKGVLLVGPPGTGKTLLARAVAGEAGVPFFSISASEFVEMFVGVGASRVRDLFARAKEAAPSIVFLDEIDAVGRQRGAGMGGGNDEREQTLNQLLVEMDGFDPKQEVIIIAATNRPDVLDPALLRPGRFDRVVTVGLPDRRGREGILAIHTREVPIAPDVSLETIARGTPGMAGAELANLVNEAVLLAARRNKNVVDSADFEDALDKIILGVARSTLMLEDERRTVAYHEAGHAMVAMLLPDADPVHKVTIIPHGMALGVTEQLPEDDRRNYRRECLEARLSVMMGGRSAEEEVLHQVTTGAENDLKEATRLARRMVTEWGMSEKIGNVAFRVDEQHPFLGRDIGGPRDYSEQTAAVIDAEVRSLVENAHTQARQLIQSHRDRLDLMVQALLKEETIGRDRLVQIMGEEIVNPPTDEDAPMSGPMNR